MADLARQRPRLIKIVAVCLMAGLLTGISATVTKAAEKEISIIGSSRIYNDVTNARNAAIAEGLLSAVELVALEMIPQENLKANFEDISAGLQDNRQNFTQGYQVLEETTTGDYYRLLIRVTVSADKIASMFQDMGISFTPEGLPRILLLVAEKQTNAFSFDYWWQKTPPELKQRGAVKSIKQILRQQGFPMVDPRELTREKLMADLELTADLTREAAVSLGGRANADVVIFGKARASESPNKMGGSIKTFQGKISLDAVNVSTQELITTVEQTGKAANRNIGQGSRSALEDAGQQAAKILADRISIAWRQQARQTGALEIHVKREGDGILEELVRLRKALRSMEGVTGLKTKERSRNEALLHLQYEGHARRLADEIILTTFKGFGVDIYELTENRIRIQLIPEQQPITETDLQ